MAIKKAKTPPVPCLCGRRPVCAKGKSGGGWIVACPASVTCSHAPTTGLHATEDQAVEAWNTLITSILYKEAQK
jgi:hypothetical protein